MAGRAHVLLEAGGIFRVHFDGTPVRSMRVSISRDFVAFTRASWLRFCNVFRSNIIDSLEVNRLDGENLDLCVHALGQIIEAVADGDSLKIRSFHVWRVKLTGAAGEDAGWERLQDVCHANLRGLEDLCFFLRLDEEEDAAEDDEIQAMEPIIQTLLSMPLLYRVTINIPSLVISPQALGNLSNCFNLNIISVSSPLMDDQILSLAAGLRSSRSLGHLEIFVRHNLAEPGRCGQALSSVLAQMPFGLDLDIYSSDVYDDDLRLQDDFWFSFSDLLRSPLESCVESMCCGQVTDDVARLFRDIAKENTTLLGLMQWPDISSLHTAAFNEIEFYMTLNRAGRAKMARQEAWTRSQWVDLLAYMNHLRLEEEYRDAFILSGLFYFLKSNPSFVHE